MRLLTASVQGRAEGGVVVGEDGVVSLRGLGFDSVLALIAAGPQAWPRVAAESAAAPVSWRLDELTLLAPIPDPPRNLWAVGVNYPRHFSEGRRPEGAAIPEIPVFFSKPWTALVGHDAEVPIDRAATQKVDWEAELAVVIGRGGVDIPAESAMEHVFGYCLANDVSARDLQLAGAPFAQWLKGKSLDGFAPLGAWITTADEVGDPAGVDLRLTVNGAERQAFSAGDMYHDVAHVIARLSLGMRLLPGDVILTGTGPGVGHWMDPPQFLQDGDVVEITSPQLGVLRNRFAERRGGSR
jgi:2-keto-4-pentenoate hydratase/2-oxohepta-3-ene-1,7-dioic acid hydratase in catechol pathway